MDWLKRATWPGLMVFALATAAADCRGGAGTEGLNATAQALAQTAQAGGQQAGTALAALPATATALAATARAAAGTAQSAVGTLAANVTQALPTAQALVTQAGDAAATARAVATLVGDDEAGAVINQYAQEVLGIAVTIVRAGGLSADVERQLRLPEDGEAAQDATASLAVQSYAALLEGGAATVSYGSGVVAGDLSVDINASSLGAFSLDAGAPPGSGDEALALALETFPGLAGRSFAPYVVQLGYAWLAQGQVPGFDPRTLEASLVSEAVLLAVTPAGARRSVVSAVVGKGDFAVQVVP
jgi:hypothetical protein